MDKHSASYPPLPTFKPLMSTAERQNVFGKFSHVAAPVAGNKEAIRILGDWEAKNIVKVTLPQLVGIEGLHNNGVIRFHKLGVNQLLAMWAEWESTGLLNRVLTYAGSYVPRFIRGSNSVLSNHAFGTAFDINAAWNPLKKTPPLVGQKGSVRELVEIAHKHGFYWGGNFKNRPDGMHFELAFVK